MIVWTPAVLSVLYACVLYFCFTWKGALEIHFLLLILLLLVYAYGSFSGAGYHYVTQRRKCYNAFTSCRLSIFSSQSTSQCDLIT